MSWRRRLRKSRMEEAVKISEAGARVYTSWSLMKGVHPEPGRQSPMTTPDRLTELRAELGDIDRELLALVARRQALASAIGELKHRRARPTRAFSQEREVLERARRAGESFGLSGDVAAALLRLLIASSLTRQEQDRLASHGGGVGRRALVIGGSGRMGGWVVRFFGSPGFGGGGSGP